MPVRLVESRLPIVAAPMAGGPTTTALVRAVASAGSFAFLAGGYQTASALAQQVEEVRTPGLDFGVNLFVPDRRPVDDVALAAYAEEIRADAEAVGVSVEANWVADDDDWDAKLALLLARPVPVVSFTFGLPDRADVVALRERGTRVLASVTTASEARMAQQVGVDGLVVQGPDAGGHSATFDPIRLPESRSLASVVAEVLGAVDLPVIAAGGIDGPAAVTAVLDAGAQAVAVGTLLLRTDEAGTSPTHRSALAYPRFTETTLTRAFTGRPARALRNGFTDRHPDAPASYPAVHQLTRSMRRAAASVGDADRLHLWAGSGWRHAPTGSAAGVIAHLAAGL